VFVLSHCWEDVASILAFALHQGFISFSLHQAVYLFIFLQFV